MPMIVVVVCLAMAKRFSRFIIIIAQRRCTLMAKDVNEMRNE